MNKSVKKLLSLSLTLAITTGIFALSNTKSAFALSELDILYKKAYDSTINALNKKTQDSINEARTNIGKLPTSLKPAIGEFSKQVDTVQHPILVKIVDSILIAQKDGTQANINVARKSIPYNLPTGWRNSYSTAVDTVQQKLITKANDAYNKANNSGAAKDILDAKLLVSELKGAEGNDAVIKFASELEAKIAKILPAEATPASGSVMTSPFGTAVVGKPVYITYNPANSGSYEYKLSVFDGTSWNLIQNYTTSNKFTWFPLKAKDFIIKVEGRTKGSTKDAEFHAKTNFTATADPSKPTDPSEPSKPPVDPNMPKIIEPNYVWNGELDYSNKPKYIILHHAEATNASALDIHRWHKDERGWAGIGYHFYVRKDGTIYRGRPEAAMGAHALGYNDVSIGICAEGSYVRELMPEAQRKAIIELGKYIKNKYSIQTIYGHGEINSTDCPGPLYDLKGIKSAILN